MKLVSFKHHGREGFGVVSGDGIIDMHPRLPRFHTLLEVLRAGALDEVRQASVDVRPDFPLSDVELLPPVVGPEKILCIGVNYANRNEEYKDNSDLPKYPSMFFRTPGSFVGLRRAADPSAGIRAARLRGRDRAGDRQGLPSHQAGPGEGSHRGLYAVQRGHDPRLAAACQVQRHAGQEFRSLRLDRSVDGDGRRDRIRQADAHRSPR